MSLETVSLGRRTGGSEYEVRRPANVTPGREKKPITSTSTCTSTWTLTWSCTCSWTAVALLADSGLTTLQRRMRSARKLDQRHPNVQTSESAARSAADQL